MKGISEKVNNPITIKKIFLDKYEYFNAWLCSMLNAKDI
jgi:hypothetical protein